MNNNMNNQYPYHSIDPYASSNMDNFVVEEPVIQRVIPVDEKKKKPRKGVIALICISFCMIFSGVGLLLFSNNNVKTSLVKDSNEILTFQKVLEKSYKSGELDTDIKQLLKEHSIDTNIVYFLPIDIDSDQELEFMVYAKDEQNRILFQFDVDEELSYEDYFYLSNQDSIGFVLSKEEESIWYTEKNHNYTMLQHRKIVIKENDFNDSYYVVTKKYNEIDLLDNMMEYKIGGKFDFSNIEEKGITKEKLLEDLKLSETDLSTVVSNYFKEKEEKEAQEKAQQDKLKELEEQKKDIFELNGVLLHYGKYVLESGSYGDFIINRDGTCVFNKKECTWTFETHQFTTKAISSILIKYDGLEKYVSSWRSNCISDNKNWNAMYQG